MMNKQDKGTVDTMKSKYTGLLLLPLIIILILGVMPLTYSTQQTYNSQNGQTLWQTNTTNSTNTINGTYNITVYWGSGCLHCAKTINALNDLGIKFNGKEIYGNLKNRRELSNMYVRYNITKDIGVPTILIDNGNVSCLIIGELGTADWKLVLSKMSLLKPGACYSYDLVKYLQTSKDIDWGHTPLIKKGDQNATLTWPAIILAAASDSINPCTIAIITMLLAAILVSGGKQKAVISGIVFSGTIYVMYMLMGFGIMGALAAPNLQKYFLVLVTIGALAMGIIEIKSYLKYKPGFGALEMPMIIRPYAKKILGAATSIPGVIVAALFCSIFLLPCSSGPYLTILALVAKEASAKHIMYLAVYNAIFIIPLLAVTLVIGGGFSTPDRVNKLKNKYIRYMHLVAGILMVLLFILLLIEALSVWNITPQVIVQV